jgi:hypothetical protein
MTFQKVGRVVLLAVTVLIMLLISAPGIFAAQGSVFESLDSESPDADCYHQWVFPESDKHFLEKEDLINLTKEQLWWARNEIFARHGYIFKSERGRKYVQSLGPCYQPREADANKLMKYEFNEYEKRNVELIRKFESMK